MKKVKIGCIGCGKIVMVSHAPAMLALGKKVEVSALYDISDKAAKKLIKEHSLNAKVCKSVKELLASDIDAVIISTPNTSHYKLTIDALNSGKHVLVEKPMATTMKQADEMIELARKKKRVLQVNQSLRFSPPYMKIKELIDSGKIGTPIHMRCLRAGGSSPDRGWSPGASWFVQKKFRGGLIMDIAVHMADIMGYYFGKAKKLYSINAIRVEGREVPDNVNTLVEYENGATGMLELSWTIPCGGGLLEIYGSKGTIRMGFGEGVQLATEGKDYKEVKPRKVKNSHECFVEAITKGTKTPSPGEVGRHALAYCLAIEKAGSSGKAVTPEFK